MYVCGILGGKRVGLVRASMCVEEGLLKAVIYLYAIPNRLSNTRAGFRAASARVNLSR